MFHYSTRLALIASRFLVESYYNGYKVPSTDVAAEYNMNIRALMPALRKLTQGGILRSQTGGNEPGFIFARDPKTISLYEVIVALEGETNFEGCRDVMGGVSCDLQNCKNCIIYSSMEKGLAAIKHTLENKTLFDHYESIKNERL